MMVDGGKGQLSMAVEVLAEYKITDQPVIGLAKRLEEALEDMDDGRNIYNHLQAITKERHKMGDYRGSEITIGYIGLCLAIQVQDPSYIEDSLEYFKKHKCDDGIKRIQEFEKKLEENKNEE